MRLTFLVLISSIYFIPIANADLVDEANKRKLWRHHAADQRFLQKIGLNPTPPPLANSTTITGSPKIEDGDTLQFGDTRVWLYGIDAPELNQTCAKPGQKINAGRMALNALQNLINNQIVTCTYGKTEFKGRKPKREGNSLYFPKFPVNIGICSTPTLKNLSLAMIKSGWVFFDDIKGLESSYVSNKIFGLPDSTLSVIKRELQRNNTGIFSDIGANACMQPAYFRNDPRP